MARRRRITLRLAVVLVAALVGSACSEQAGGVGFVAKGASAPLPSVSLVSVSEREFAAIIRGQRGRPVVVNVWASWCGPCRVEAPLLQRAAGKYAGRVTFLGVNAQDDLSAARRFIERYDLRYPNVVDPDGAITRRLGMRGFPTTYIFDRAGRVQFSVVGGISEQTLAARLAQVLR